MTEVHFEQVRDAETEVTRNSVFRELASCRLKADAQRATNEHYKRNPSSTMGVGYNPCGLCFVL